MKKKLFIIISFITGSILFSCRESYKPLTEAGEKHYLVVEGLINAGADTTTIKLSRTILLNDTAQAQPELNATVTVESGGAVFPLTEKGNGAYTIASLSLPAGSECRLRIHTANGKEYLSDVVPVLPTPAIDSVNWIQTEPGVQIYVNTHDPQNNTRYYRWEFVETWQIRSYFLSTIEYKDGAIVPRDPFENILNCWKSEPSTTLLLGSSVRLADDIMKDQPLNFVPANSWKIAVKYSILVRQSSLTKEAYDYLSNMKKNSEQLGTIFDPMPSQLPGNIKCLSDPQELVIGYVCAGSTNEKRIFIDTHDLDHWRYHEDCEEKFVSPDSIDYYFKDKLLIPLFFDIMKGYHAGTEFCVDCRIRGSNVKPDFWP
jgi:hypothetical protein